MNSYMELRYLRGDQTVDGILKYLDFLERRIKDDLQSKNKKTFFGEGEDDETDKYSGGYCHFSVPEWLSMGRDIEEWLAYALSLEMTNYYINSPERVVKENIRNGQIKQICESRNQLNINKRNVGKFYFSSMNREDRIRMANENLARRKEAAQVEQDLFKEISLNDCLSSIVIKKKDIISFLKSLEEISENDSISIDDLFAQRLVAALDRVRSHNKDDFLEIDKRKSRSELEISNMLNETIQYLKGNHFYWKSRADELAQMVAEDVNRYNIPFMKTMFQLAKTTDREPLIHSNNTDDSTKRPSISAEIRREVWRRDQGRCSKCGSRQNLEYDHIVPISKGGSSTARNIELLCQECNRKKSNKIC